MKIDHYDFDPESYSSITSRPFSGTVTSPHSANDRMLTTILDESLPEGTVRISADLWEKLKRYNITICPPNK